MPLLHGRCPSYRERDKDELCFRRALVCSNEKKWMKTGMERDIEIHGQSRDQCSAPAGHRRVFIVLNEACSGWVACIECLERQVATGRDQGGREGMRCEDVMEQDDGEE